MNTGPQHDTRPTLIGYLPPLGGIRKTGANYPWHAQHINIGDIVYAYAGAMLTSGRNFAAWNFTMTAEEVNEKFSKVIFFIPCRIAPPPYDQDGYAYEFITRFIEQLKIPFFSLGESIQTKSYEYEPDVHKTLSPKVVRYLHTIADRSPLVGTRGDYSTDVLHKMGIKSAVTLGCPSLYVNGPALNASLARRPQSPNNLAVCYSNYQGNPHSRIRDFLQFADQADCHYIEQTFGLIPQAMYYPGKISGADIHAAKKTYQDLAPLLSLLRKGLVRYFTNYTLWKDFMASMDFAFGARMHGLTPALHAGTPAVFIAHDARVREMCEFFSLPFVAEQDLPDTVSVDFFLSRCDYTAAIGRYPATYRRFAETLHHHGIADNIASDGRIIDAWLPTPDPQVVREESGGSWTQEDQTCLVQQVALCSDIPDAAFEKLARIQSIAKNWYTSRRDRE